MKDTPRQSFRWAPHTSGVTVIKLKDFEEAGEVAAANFYDAWTGLRGTERALDIGDVLEDASGSLRICKYVGFEEAKWAVIEQRPLIEPPASAIPALAPA